MEAKNFRIGNIVNIKKNVRQDGSCITENSYFEISELKKDVVHFKGFYYAEYYEDLVPININDEILSNYGFKKDSIGNMWFDLTTHWLSLIFVDGFYYPLYAQQPEIGQEDEQIVSLNRIKFVHELQNLFFALTGKELEM